MELANTIIGALGDLLVVIALVVAVKALNTANGARADAIKSDKDAVQARKDAAEREIQASEQARQAAAEASERDREAAVRAVETRRIIAMERRRERLEQIGGVVEDIYWSVEPGAQGHTVVSPRMWMPLRNRLAHLMVGFTNALPVTASIEDCNSTSAVFETATQAREEVTSAIADIDNLFNQLQDRFLN